MSCLDKCLGEGNEQCYFCFSIVYVSDYGLLEASMTTEEKIELFDTLEQSKLSAQHQPRKPEKDIEDVSILPVRLSILFAFSDGCRSIVQFLNF